MDFIKDLGKLALVSRMRRISDRLAQDVAAIYRDSDLDFDPTWFTIYALLYDRGPTSIMDIAKSLGVTHPAVNQVANALIEHEIVVALPDANDKRKRLLTLTPKGEALHPALRSVWSAIEKAIGDVLEEADIDLLCSLDRMEKVLDDVPYLQRIQHHINNSEKLVGNKNEHATSNLIK